MNRLAKRLDPRLDGMAVFHDLTEAEEAEFARSDGDLDELEAAMALSTMPERWMARREAEFGVAVDVSKPLSQRRSVLMARLRGQGATTPAFVRRLAASFENGEVEIVENDTPYHVSIKFTSLYGVPPNLEDFNAALRELLPAHLVLDYIYSYMTWAEHDGYHKSWSEWDALGLTWDAFQEYRE